LIRRILGPASLFAALAFACLWSAARADQPTTASGLVIFGTILPTRTLVPPLSGIGSPESSRPGPDFVEGFDANGRRVFAAHFADDIYNFYVFVKIDDARLARVVRLRVRVGRYTLERVATKHGPAAARAALVGSRVHITWDDRAFPRLSCTGAPGSSPAPLMLEGSFDAANILGPTLFCDFSDGVKTVFRNVRIPIAAARPYPFLGETP
jgi:hypothetical protein